MASFDGLGVLITGAATGLGAATALGVAREGARVIINYASSRSAAEATADACRGAGADVRIVQGNVADDADCRRIAETAGDWGRLDALINNAGATKHVPHSNLDALSADDFYRLLGVNTVGHSRWCARSAHCWRKGHALPVTRRRSSMCRLLACSMAAGPRSPIPPARRR